MARGRYNKNYGRKSNRTAKKGKTHAQEVKHTAYLMGCVERGCKNPDSQISASFNAGKNKAQSNKKSLY